MKKTVIFIFFTVITAITMLECSGKYIQMPEVKIKSNIPHHGTHITIINSTNYQLSVIVDGSPIVNKKSGERVFIRPGENLRVDKRNLSGQGSQMSIAIVAFDREMNYHGATQRNWYVSGYSGQSQTWIVEKYELK
jgi:hypothetical protein